MVRKFGALGLVLALVAAVPQIAGAQTELQPSAPSYAASPTPVPDVAPPAGFETPAPALEETPAPSVTHSTFVQIPVVVATSAARTPLPNPAGAIVPVQPGESWSASQLASLRRDIDDLLSGAPALRGAHVGVLAVDSSTGTVLYRSNAGDEFQPASTTKLVVGSATLDRLGPDYQWTTSLDALSDDPSSALLLRGGGDPLLAGTDLRDAAAAAKAAGYTGVPSVVIDDTRYVSPRYPDGWVWDDFGQDYAARPSAATVEENVVHLHILPGDDVGAPANVQAESGVRIDAEGGDCVDAFAAPDLTVHSSVTTGAAGSDRDVDVAIDRGGCPSVFGSMPLGSSMHSIDVSVESPAIYTHGVLDYELARAGVITPAQDVVAFPHRYGERSIRALRSHVSAQVWQHQSSPLQAILGPDLWIPSDNFVAEMLLDELGFVTGGAPGSTGKGLTYERHWLQSIGVDLDTVTLADGSGLSQYDRLTPTDEVAILQHDWNGPHRDVVLRSLPIGGMRGTIESLTGTPLTGRIFAKTGNMSHVHGLAGYLATVHHGSVTFAFLVDDCNPPYAEVSALRARVLSRIVTSQ